jgi:hypothetical protein
MKTMNEPAHAIKRQALLEEFDEILAFVQHAFQEGARRRRWRADCGNGC